MCQILQVISSIPSCKLIEETCERKFSMNFDYCTTASVDFVMLEKATFGSILQVWWLCFTSLCILDQKLTILSMILFLFTCGSVEFPRLSTNQHTVSV